jgi:hypothetical protein
MSVCMVCTFWAVVGMRCCVRRHMLVYCINDSGVPERVRGNDLPLLQCSPTVVEWYCIPLLQCMHVTRKLVHSKL